MLQGLNQQATQEELLATIGYLLMAMLEKMPRLDTNDRIILGSNEITQNVSLPSGQNLGTLNWLNTVGQVNDQTNIGGRSAGVAMFAMSNMGASNIYNNIKVS